MILKASFASPMKNMLAETIKEFIKEYCFQNNLTPFIKKLKKTSFIELIKKIKEEKNLILKEKIFNELNFNNILNELKDDYPQISLFSIEEIEKITKELSIPKEKVQIIKKKLEKNSNIRNILQILGTEILRENIDKDIHIGLFSLFLLKKIENIEKININTYMGLPGSGKDFVSVNLEKEKQKENELLIYFTDSRFLNEVFFIQSLKNTKNKTELIQILKEKIKTTNFNIKISEELENFFPFFKEYKKSLKLINKIKSESNIQRKMVLKDSNIEEIFFIKTKRYGKDINEEAIESLKENTKENILYTDLVIDEIYKNGDLLIRDSFKTLNHPSEYVSTLIIELSYLFENIEILTIDNPDDMNIKDKIKLLKQYSEEKYKSFFGVQILPEERVFIDNIINNHHKIILINNHMKKSIEQIRVEILVKKFYKFQINKKETFHLKEKDLKEILNLLKNEKIRKEELLLNELKKIISYSFLMTNDKKYQKIKKEIDLLITSIKSNTKNYFKQPHS